MERSVKTLCSLSSAGSENSSAPPTRPDGFNWSPLAWCRAQESLSINRVRRKVVIVMVITLIRRSVTYILSQADAEQTCMPTLRLYSRSVDIAVIHKVSV